MKSVKLNNSAPIKVHGLPEGGGSGESLDFTIIMTVDIVDGNPVPRTDAKWSDIINAMHSGKRIWLNIPNPIVNMTVLMTSCTADETGQLNGLEFNQTTYITASGSVNAIYVTSFTVYHEKSEEDEDKVTITYGNSSRTF